MTAAQKETLTNVVDVDELLGRCLGNLAFAERILAVFQQRCGTDLEELERAIDSEDLERVAAIAHRLKGACANAAAHSLYERITQLRKAACAGAIVDVSAHYRNLRNDWGNFVAAVPELEWKTDAAQST
jgi:HPt (histidine-containing phosphotransfer) domain-containing protein